MKVTPIRECSYVADRQREDAMIARERRRANKEIEEQAREEIRAVLYREGNKTVTYTESGRVKFWESVNIGAPIVIAVFLVVGVLV